MPQQDTSQLKEKIIQILRSRGPSLPVHIAKGTGLNSLFASAFLSELISEKKIKISNMKVGNSPIYFLDGQQPKLAEFSQHLGSKEREAFSILQSKKFLKDIEQEPAIRVALRSIKDFAMPFKKNDEIYWRYFIIPESELGNWEPIKKEIKPEIPKEIIPQKILPTPEPIKKEKVLDIFEEEKSPRDDSKEPKKPIIKKPSPKVTRKKASSNNDEKFFNKVKEYLTHKGIEISDIINFNKKELTLKVITDGQEKLLIAFNKRKITEIDIIKGHKKAIEYSLKYIILSLSEPSKKLGNFIEAIKNMDNIGKIE